MSMNTIELTNMAQQFTDALLDTEREGMYGVIDNLRTGGFFKAPASSKFHGAYEGGLLEHSLNVLNVATGIDEDMQGLGYKGVRGDSLIIVCLLHDVCKMDLYRRTEDGWDKDYSACPLGHGEKSVILLQKWGLKLKDDEVLAIRWHMGKWDLSEYVDAKRGFDAACSKTPLLPILMAADMLAARIIEEGEVAE